MWISTILLTVVVVLFLTWLHRYMTFRPKNFPPGPLRLPIWGSYVFCLLEDWNFPHLPMQRWMKRYGNFFGMYLGPFPCVIVGDYDTVKEVLTRQEFDGKPPLYAAQVRGLMQDLGIFFTEGPFWHEQRRFSLRYLRDFGFGRRFEKLERLMEDEIHNVIEFIKNGKPESGDKDIWRDNGMLLPDLLFPCMMNSIMSIFGVEPAPFGTSKYRSIRDVGRGIIRLQKGIFPLGVINILPWLRHVFPDLLGYTDLEENDQLHMTTIDYMFPAVTAVTATLVHLMQHLLIEPEIQTKIQKEIDEIVGRGRLPTLDDRKDMPYTEATIRELMRKETLVPLGVPHRTMVDTTLRGYDIPKDTLIYTSLYGAHNDKKIWGDPENFRPERFIDSSGKLVKKDFSLPFGAGKRLCAGETFARNSLFLLTTCLIQNFTFKVPKGGRLPSVDQKIPGLVNFAKEECWVEAVTRN